MQVTSRFCYETLSLDIAGSGLDVEAAPPVELICGGRVIQFVALLLAATSPIFSWTATGVRVAGPYILGASATSDGNGGITLAWGDYARSRTSSQGALGRIGHLDSDGHPLLSWSSSAVLSPASENAQPSHITSDGLGGAYVAWIRGNSGPPTDLDALFTRIGADGLPAAGWPDTGIAIGSTAGPDTPTGLCSDGQNGAFVSWGESGTPARALIQHYLPSGAHSAGWPDGGRLIRPLAYSNTSVQELVPDGSGGVYAVLGAGAGGYHGYVQHILGSGALAPGWPDSGLVFSSLYSNEFVIEGVPDGSGGIIVAWDDDREAPPNPDPYSLYGDIYAQHFAADGTRPAGWPSAGLPVCVAPGAQWNARLCADGSGGALICWSNRQLPGGMGVQHVRGDGTVAPGWPQNGRLVGDRTTSGALPRIVADGAGGGFLAWIADDAVDAQPLCAQHVTAEGFTASGWPLPAAVVTPAGLFTDAPAFNIVSGLNAAIVTWDQRTPGDITQWGLWAQKLSDSGLVPTNLTLQDAKTTQTSVTLRWWGTAAARQQTEVQRSTDAVEWKTLGPPSATSDDELLFIDQSVATGARYAYRLLGGSGVALAAPAWVDVPQALCFALSGAHPNPCPAGQMSVAFTLARQGAGTLDVVDVSGRRMAWRDLTNLGAGRYTANFSETGRFAPGLYWLRLTQGADRATARVVVVQ